MVSAMLDWLMAKMEKKAPKSWYNGAPGWPHFQVAGRGNVFAGIPKVYGRFNGRPVSKSAMANTNQPVILFHLKKIEIGHEVNIYWLGRI